MLLNIFDANVTANDCITIFSKRTKRDVLATVKLSLFAELKWL